MALSCNLTACIWYHKPTSLHKLILGLSLSVMIKHDIINKTCSHEFLWYHLNYSTARTQVTYVKNLKFKNGSLAFLSIS